jgi:enediyne biosynthesis protein E4
MAAVLLAACSPSPNSSDDGDAGGDGGSETTTARTGGPIAVTLEGDDELTLGEPLELTMTLANSGGRSVAAPVDVSLVSPDGTKLPFYRTSLFVPFGQTASETVTVTTSRWYADTGDFELVAEVTDTAIASTVGDHRFRVVPSTRVAPTLVDVTAVAGLTTTMPSADCGQFSTGAAWADVDGDGWQDLVVARIGDPVQLFVSRGDGTFADETASRGIAVRGANGVAFADYDNDGDPDLAVVGDGPDHLLRNDADGRFTDVTVTARTAGDPAHRGMSATWGDYDDDGLLDLYVTNYMECTGPWDTAGNVISNVAYHPDVLYHNEGDGTFRDATTDLPESDTDAAGFTAAWLDVDGDERLDLFVANDFVGISPDHNRLWQNDGPGGADDWTFSDVSLESGTGLYMNTMGVGVGDIDRDGDLDMALSNIGGNKLLRGNGDGTFVEEPNTGIERPRQGIDHFTVTWSTSFYDLDLDGWEDLFMTAGNLPQGPGVNVGDQPNMVFLNDGTGTRFLDVSALSGVDDVEQSKGAAFADYDNDGDMDVFVVNQSGSPRLYRNDTPRGDNHWLEVQTVGTESNRDGCGAVVSVVVDDDDEDAEAIVRQVLCGSGGTSSANQRAVHFGLGAATTIDRIQILWPSGTRQTIDDVAVDQTMTIEEQ